MAAWNFKDITGEVFNKLTVIRLNVGDHHDCTRWECKCECGNYKTVRGKDLKSGRIKSCGCSKGRAFIDISGLKIGRLLVLSLHSKGIGKGNGNKWNCKCDCGNTAIVPGGNLRRGGYTLSCGCIQRERTSKAKKKHGCYAANQRLAGIWGKMKRRCNNTKDSSFFKYGSRGISVCEEWNNSIESFFDWALSNGYEATLTIDRVNNGNDIQVYTK